MQALILDRSHQVISLSESPLFSFEVKEEEEPLEALHRALPQSLIPLPSPWGQAWHVDDRNRLRGLVFIVDKDWADAAVSIQPSLTRRKLADCLCDDAVWELYCDGLLGGYRPTHRLLDVFHFGNSPLMASQLAHLVIKGRKRLTAGWLAACQSRGEIIPSSGLLSIVTDGFGAPLCLIETIQVDIVPFCDIRHDVAVEEGEGDLTFSDWQDGHRKYFEQEAKDMNMDFTHQSLIFLERFRIIKVFGG